jgi:hypothetical protein
MKLLFTVAFSLFASAAMACTNFSGSYRNDVEGKIYSIQQSGCSSISAEGQTIITDGQYRVLNEDETGRVMVAASFVDANLNVDTTIEYKVSIPPEFPEEMIPVKITIIYSMDSAGNLTTLSTAYNSHGQVISSESNTDQRI